jgi:hypothetical protein
LSTTLPTTIQAKFRYKNYPRKAGLSKTTKKMDETKELADSISLMRRAEESILLRNDWIYKTAWKKPVWKGGPLQYPQGALYVQVEY